MKHKHAILGLCLGAIPLLFLLAVGSGLDTAFVATAAAQGNGPSLTIPQALPAVVGISVTVPVHFRTGGAAVASVVFSIDFDESSLRFDARDSNNDGQPDSVRFSQPAAFRGSVSYTAADLDGELDFVIADFSPPIATLPDTDALVTLDFTPICAPSTATPITTAIAFSNAPGVSFGAPNGNTLTGTASGGTVVIANPAAATPTVTATTMPTVTATVTPTATPTATPTIVPTTPPTTLIPTTEPLLPLLRVFLPWIRR